LGRFGRAATLHPGGSSNVAYEHGHGHCAQACRNVTIEGTAMESGDIMSVTRARGSNGATATFTVL
jgi:hypothetical protein